MILVIFQSAVMAAIVCLLAASAIGVVRSDSTRKFFLPFFFFLVSGLLTLSLGLNFFGVFSRAVYVRLYWANELIEQGFALALMVFVVRLTLAGERPAGIVGQGLASVAAVLVAILVTDGSPSLGNRWMTGFTRNLSFAVALMNFQVWGVLVARRVRDRRLLLLAAGLGLMTTGKSLGHTIRIVASQGSWALELGGYIVMATGLAAAYAWYHAFRAPGKPPQSSEIRLVKAA